MGVYAGPDVSESGLVLALDGANYKSFKGEATTNEIVSVTWWGDGSNQASFVKETVLITDENLKYNGYETYLWSPGTSNNCYLNGGDLSTGRTSTVWTFSCYIKRQDGAPITSLNVYMYYPSGDGSATGTIQDVGNGWYRVSRTRTGTNNYLSLIGFTGFVTGYKYYLSGAQLEKKSYPTTVVATNTTRGTTVATGGGWADLTGNGNHGELANGVRESSDNLGALVFDGSDEYVNLGSFFNYQTFTIELWVNPGTTQTTYADIFDNNHTGSQNFVLQQNANDLNNYAFGVIDASGTISSTGTIILTANTWTHLAFTFSPSTRVIAYVNGDFYSQGNLANGRTINYVSPNLSLGRWSYGNSRFWKGNISNFKTYNRILTASEIQQNFNANRSRFGI